MARSRRYSRPRSLPAVEQGIQDFLTRFVNDLPFRERMVARLVLTDRTVEKKIVEALERPIGRPGQWLPPDTAERLALPLAPANLVVDRAAHPRRWSKRFRVQGDGRA